MIIILAACLFPCQPGCADTLSQSTSGGLPDDTIPSCCALQLFPALDIARLVVLSPQGAATLGGSITASSSTGFDSSSSQPALVAALKTAAAAFQPGAEGESR
jgi:hypothetical protein